MSPSFVSNRYRNLLNVAIIWPNSSCSSGGGESEYPVRVLKSWIEIVPYLLPQIREVPLMHQSNASVKLNVLVAKPIFRLSSKYTVVPNQSALALKLSSCKENTNSIS